MPLFDPPLIAPDEPPRRVVVLPLPLPSGFTPGWVDLPVVSFTLLAPTFPLLDVPVAPVALLDVPLLRALLLDFAPFVVPVLPLPVPLPSGLTPGCVALPAFVS